MSREDNHFVPQFYMRLFACLDDKNKVEAIFHRDPFVFQARKSIVSIGCEKNLYLIEGSHLSLEKRINNNIETPFTETTTWKKISKGNYRDLSAEDKWNLFLFIKHLKDRNLEILSFMELENERIQKHGFPPDYSSEEREMYSFLSQSATHRKSFFQNMASSLAHLSLNFEKANISIVFSRRRLRTSSNPVLPLSNNFNSEVEEPRSEPSSYWLPIGANVGVMLTISEAFFDFVHTEAPDDAVRFFNRLYMCQLFNSFSSNVWVIAGDEDVEVDLAWAGWQIENQNSRRKKFKRID